MLLPWEGIWLGHRGWDWIPVHYLSFPSGGRSQRPALLLSILFPLGPNPGFSSVLIAVILPVISAQHPLPQSFHICLPVPTG